MNLSRISIIFIFLFFVITSIFGQAVSKNKRISFDQPSQEERKLHRLINEYRTGLGLSSIRLSKSLTNVARIHARDLNTYPPGGRCNMHSWSSNGKWSSCCYTSDHARASCMWNKPKELTNYPGYGYECSHMTSATAAAYESLRGWKGSSGHNAVITSQGIWKSHPWKSIGVGIYGHYSVIWFGEEVDPDGYW